MANSPGVTESLPANKSMSSTDDDTTSAEPTPDEWSGAVSTETGDETRGDQSPAVIELCRIGGGLRRGRNE